MSTRYQTEPALPAVQALPGATDAMELAIVDSRLRAVEGLLRESLVQD